MAFARLSCRPQVVGSSCSGKNLATLPVIACSSLLLFLLISVWLRSSVFTTLAGLFQMAVLWVIAQVWGNLLSILVPYRIQAGSMKPSKVPAGAMLVIIVCQLLFPLVIFPVFAPPLAELIWDFAGMPGTVPINLVLSIGLAVLAAFLLADSSFPRAALATPRDENLGNCDIRS